MTSLNSILLRALFRHTNHCGAQLPYNWNWMIQLGAEEKRFLSQHPLTVCDIGARGSAPEELLPFYPHMELHAFEPDKEESERLSSSPHLYHALRVFPYFVGGETGRTVFNLFKDRGHSSFYEPSKRFKEIFCGKHFAVEEKVDVDATSLDAVYSKEVEPPDFLKIDTQKKKKKILQGGTTALKNISMVETEVMFLEMYEGQPLFHDVAKLMAQNGFDLLYLNRVFGQRNPVYSKKSRGQLIWGDALFGRREDCFDGMSIDKLTRYVLLLLNYGHLDFAYHLTKIYPEILESLPSLAGYFAENKLWSKFRYKVFSQIDKLCILWLHLRKFNSLDQDSDRGWPFR